MAEEEKPEEEEVEEEEEEEEKSFKEELKETLKGMEADIKGDLETKLKDLVEKELEKKEKKLGAYNKQEDDEEETQEEKNEKFVKMLQEVKGKDKVINRDFTTKTMDTSDPSEVIDDEISFEIMNATETYGVARELFRTHELSKNQYKANELNADISVGWVDEQGSISATTFTVTQNTLSLEKLAAIVIMSRELMEDTEVDLRSFLTDRIGQEFAKAEDDVFFAGDSSGSDPVDGLLNDSNLEELTMDSGDTAASDLDADYLLDLQAEVPSTVRENSSYVMSFDVFNIVRKLKDSNNNPIYKDVAGEGPDTIHGKPVVISEAMPSSSDVSAGDSFVLFGDFNRGAVLGTKGGIRIDTATQGVVSDSGSTDQNLFQTDQVAFRFVERVGYVYVLTNTIAKLTTNTS